MRPHSPLRPEVHAALYERSRAIIRGEKVKPKERKIERERKTMENRGAGLQRPFTGDRDK